MTTTLIIIAILMSLGIYFITKLQRNKAYEDGKKAGVTEFKNTLIQDRSGLAMKHLEMEVTQGRIERL